MIHNNMAFDTKDDENSVLSLESDFLFILCLHFSSFYVKILMLSF